MPKHRNHVRFNLVHRMIPVDLMGSFKSLLEFDPNVKAYRFRYRGPRKGNQYGTIKKNATHFTAYVEMENI